VLWVTGLFLLICYIEKIRQRRKIFYFSYLPAIALPIDKRKGKKQSHSKPCYSLRMVILMLGFFGSLFWFHYVSNKGLEVTCLDVGQGDAIVCELPDKTVLCIDGGSSSTSHVGTQIIEPYLLSHGIDRVNHWVITHPDSDHYSGILQLLQAGYSVEHLWMANVFREDELVQILESFRTVEWMDANDTLQGNSFKWEVLSPSKTEGSSMSGNDLSVVLLLTVGDTRILFTGDMGFAGESQVIEALQGRQIDILKVAHHGSKNATSEEFLQNTRPKIALLSCGRNNRYGHPHAELLERLEKINAKILRTDKQGMLQFQFHN
jgi:competence protein ComEC